ncbi:MAG: GTP-binding protein [Myxococcota bacterium]
MATIDDNRGVLVVRIVYDGPALSGKTTSLLALGRGVGKEVHSLAERDGRTLFFDWIDYVGGLFEGRQIRCQIISVPGQRELAHRRELLLDSADAVVLVLDTREHEWQFGLRWLQDTLRRCRAREPSAGVVLQANKRDAPDAVPRELLRESLRELPPVAVVESSATSGDGIREAFVLAVRLALDRVRALAAAGELGYGRAEEDAPEELLSKLLAEEGNSTKLNGSFVESAGAAIHAEFGHVTRGHRGSETARPREDEIPFVPDPMMPGGMIWPPVDGRVLLHEVAAHQIRPTRTARADWWGAESGFRFHSAKSSIFEDPRDARNELIEWARLHAANAAHLSPGRAVILADAGRGRLRLWQILRAEATLRERLSAAVALPEASAVARELLALAHQLTRSREAFRSATVPLPCTLWTLGSNETGRPCFVGLMPLCDHHPPSELEGGELVARELVPHLRELRRTRVDYRDVVREVVALAPRAPHAGTAKALVELFEEVCS